MNPRQNKTQRQKNLFELLNAYSHHFLQNAQSELDAQKTLILNHLASANTTLQEKADDIRLFGEFVRDNEEEHPDLISHFQSVLFHDGWDEQINATKDEWVADILLQDKLLRIEELA